MSAIIPFILAYWKQAVAIILAIAIYLYIYHRGYSQCELQIEAAKVKAKDEQQANDVKAQAKLKQDYDAQMQKQKLYSNDLEKKLNAFLKDKKNQPVLSCQLPAGSVQLYNSAGNSKK